MSSYSLQTRGTLTFLDGIRAAIPVMVGYLPAGMTFGILARGVPVHILDVIGFSGIVFAGASQYMAINLLKSGAAYIEIIIATFLLNFRHFLMSASISQRLKEKKVSRLAALAYSVTDETFSVASAETRELTAPYLVGLGLFSWLSWNVGSLIGYLAGSYLPDRIEAAMGVALYALFAALLVPQVKKSLTFAAFAAAAGGLHYVISLSAILTKGWTFVLSIVLSALLGTIVLTLQEKRGKAA
ncbi:MAG: AzlC family ABC transporter permease [Spirochaetales bacterium]|jgi:4-azaleucine resistance transporter AzlC|nr:AzlC family ABC transporter permease [Spirochaetales bacterium]